MKIELEIPDQYSYFFEYLEIYFFIDKKSYLEKVIINEIESRNDDLKIDIQLANKPKKNILESIEPIEKSLEKQTDKNIKGNPN